jgi:hypothetical protein
MQVLVRMQVRMLARIVVEIRSADLAVELEPYVVCRDDVFYCNMLTTPTSFY